MQRPPMRLDEWTVLFKYQNGVAEEEAKAKAAAKASKRVELRGDLAKQVDVVAARKAEAREEVKRFAAVQAADQLRWKAEEEAKILKKKEAVAQLRLDRDAQLAAKAAEAEAAEKQRRREVAEARKAELLEHLKAQREEEAAHERTRAELAKFEESNASLLESKARAKQAAAEDALRMQFEYAERLRVQEEEREAKLAAMKAKQKLAEIAGNMVGPYKRYLDEKIIEANFQQREAAVEASERAAKEKVKALRQDLKAGLEKQLVEKQAAVKQLKEKDRTMVERVLEGAKVAQLIENERVVREKMETVKARMALEEQIKHNAETKLKALMSDTEKQFNFQARRWRGRTSARLLVSGQGLCPSHINTVHSLRRPCSAFRALPYRCLCAAR